MEPPTVSKQQVNNLCRRLCLYIDPGVPNRDKDNSLLGQIRDIRRDIENSGSGKRD